MGAGTSPSSTSARAAPTGRGWLDEAPAASTASRASAASTTPDAARTPPAAPEQAAAPGLREQLGNTKSAASRLVGSHVDLAKSEFGEILEEVKRVALLAGIAIGALMVVGLMLVIGGSLFVGETLFGSLGWGVLHGTLILVGIAVAALLRALQVGGVRRALLIGLVVGIVVGVVLGLDLTNRLWTALGNAAAGPVAPDIRPLVVGAGVLALLGAIVGAVLGGRSGGSLAAVVGFVVGALLGALVGLVTAIALGPRVGAAVGVTVALLTWIGIMGAAVASRGVDGEALKAQFWPRQTIETTKETIEWVREQTPLGRKS